VVAQIRCFIYDANVNLRLFSFELYRTCQTGRPRANYQNRYFVVLFIV